MAELVVSAEFVQPGVVGGAEQALQYLLSGLSAALAEGDRLSIVATDRDVLPGLATDLGSAAWMRTRFLRETTTFARLAPGCDAYYFPNYFTPPWPSRARVVTTIHDQQYQHLPENFSSRKRMWLSAAHRLTLRRADVVTVISNWVREDLLRTHGDRYSEKVTVLPNAVAWSYLESDIDPLTARPFVLSVASHYSHKNLGTLIRAFKLVHDKVPELHLVLVGQLGDRLIGVRKADDVRGRIAELEMEDGILMTGFITASELGALYRHAELFVFPSVFEGFGLPPVEALGFGVPVITTRCTSLPEVTMGLADYVDNPFDADELSRRILETLRKPRRLEQSVVDMVRKRYDPLTIGRRLYELLTAGL